MMIRNTLFILLILVLTTVTAQADIGDYLDKLNLSAKVNLTDFKVDVGARFSTSGVKLDLAFRSVDSPAEAAVVLWLKEKSGASLDTVLSTYKRNKKKGWGAMAKELGIKPGSAAFHALKKGDIDFAPNGVAKKSKMIGKGRGKGKGKK